jgi:hypothetical protein
VKLHELTGPIRAALSKQVDNSEAWHPEVLIFPPSVKLEKFLVRLEKQPTGARPVLSLESRGLGDGAERPKSLEKDYHTHFRRKIFQVANNIRSIPNEMRMRVHFGLLRLQEWKKDKETYTYSELEAVTRRLGFRGTFKLDQL